MSDRKTVLLIEDDPDNLRLAQTVIEREHHSVRIARNGTEALAALAEGRPSLILLDLDLPEISGFEIARRIRADPALEGVTIVAVTALAFPRAEEQARAAGCNDFVAKPCRPADLRRLLQRWLSTS